MNDETTLGVAALIEVAGLGMGAALSRTEMERILSADVLAGGIRLLARFSHLPGERVVLSSPLEEALDSIARARDAGKRVVVLADGDPLFFGIGARLLDRFGQDSLRFSPGITAVQAASARIGMTWQDLPVVSLHGRSDTGPLLSALTSAGRAAVYTDQANSPDALALVLREHGLEDAILWVLEDLGAPGERVRRLTVSEACREEFSPLNIVVVEVPAAPGGRPLLGRPDEEYEKEHGLITKWPARACSLAALRLTPASVLWDVGAGCGSVSIEACALIATGRVFAVERDAERYRAIRENVRRFGAWLVKAVKGEAPEAFAALPDPDRIFLGGSLGSGTTALAEACRRLKPGGRIVANTVLLGSLNHALEHFRSLGWPVEAAQIQASQSSPLAGDLRLAAHNPVFILTADKPA